MELQEKPRLLKFNVFIFSFSLFLAVIVAPWYGMTYGYGIEHWLWLFICFSFCNLSITAGYHRLWSHKTFNSHPSLRFIFALGGAFALQNSALHWSSDHRIHHKHVDDHDKDPYCAKRGFWFSHIGWMLRNYNESADQDYTNCRDLKRDNIVVWQHKYYVPLALLMNFGVPIALGIIYGDIWGMILMVGAVRLVLNHHTTFFINSLAHIWGKQPYTDKNTARDNGILALFTFGEGYHNFHHIFENDYRNGIDWWQYDPTKWLIKACSWLGLTSNLRVTSPQKIEKARAQMSFKTVEDKVLNRPNHKQIIDKLQLEFDLLVDEMNEYYAVKKQLLEIKKEDAVKRYEHALLKVRHQQIEVRFQQQRQRWSSMVAQYI
ncbi:acyl-CoA desaturase [Vibrio sp. 10N.286.49.B3]|uniref:acyl-CoA desaturase n=1 Tax=Vibrio sp. 10N.286.49.B3 TaxID=1880855 RepID=UPI000C85AE08|nr:fatty acid desaturase [Vibrio sp. 10N.286.49.B3]PMH43279.1 acyl-CoA desaturase [Vibrio sp. 10N.286.49.B3]